MATINGRLIGEENRTYSLQLKRSSDSVLTKLELSQNQGRYVLEGIPYGNYFIDVLYLNERLYRIPDVTVDRAGVEVPEVTLPSTALLLKEVRIVQSKPLIEQQAGKLVYHVDRSIEAPGNDALQVIQKAPGITVDQGGNISMRGKKGVLVMLNGKPTYLSGAQLANLLRSTTASQIAKVEVISNPSAKYDAEGNAGIVNIVMKKDQRRGTNGLIVCSGGMGRFHKTANGANINVRGTKLNVFASVNVFANKNYNDLRLQRWFFQQGNFIGAYIQNNMLWFPSISGVGKVGLEYQLTPRTTLGITTTQAFTGLNTAGDNFCTVYNQNNEKVSTYTSTQQSKDRYSNRSMNFNARTQLDSAGSEWSLDLDYAFFGNTNDQQFLTTYARLDGTPLQPDYKLRGDVLSQLPIYAAKTDAVLFRKGIKWEFGAKSSYVNADNNIGFYNESNGPGIFDSNQSNHFIYTENINAGYGIASFERKGYQFQVGLRTEQTIAKGKQLLNGQSFHRNYWQLFPNLAISKPLNKNNDLGFSFSRRIQRPGYDLMNPVRLFIDATTYKVGNPFLVPQNSYLMEVNHTLKQKYLTTLSAMWVNKSITEVLIPDETQTNITIQTNKNLNTQQVYSLNTTIPIKVSSWWSMNNDVSTYYSYYKGQLAGTRIASGIVSFNAKTIHSIQAPKGYALQVEGFYQFGEWYSFTTIRPFGNVNFSAQKTLPNKRTTIKLSANDIFFTSRFRGSSNYTDYQEKYYVQRDSRTLVVSISHKYGKPTVPGMRKRNTGADDEKQRAGKNV